MLHVFAHYSKQARVVTGDTKKFGLMAGAQLDDWQASCFLLYRKYGEMHERSTGVKN